MSFLKKIFSKKKVVEEEPKYEYEVTGDFVMTPDKTTHSYRNPTLTEGKMGGGKRR